MVWCLSVKGILIYLLKITDKLYSVNGIQSESFADWVKKLRNNEKLTQTQLASLVSLTQSDISEIENGRDPSADEIIKLAIGLNLSIDHVAVKAGIADSEGLDEAKEDATFGEIRRILAKLSPERRDDAVRWLTAYSQLVEEEDRSKRGEKASASSPKNKRRS